MEVDCQMISHDNVQRMLGNVVNLFVIEHILYVMLDTLNANFICWHI